MAEVTYDSATCIYPGAERPAVDNLQLAIADGEFVVMVGPSGCGKTTALRMLAGLEEIDGGAIRIDGKDMNGVPSRDRDIAMVFQNYALYPSKTVAENMGFALKMQGVPKDKRARRVREAAKLLELEQLLDRKPKNLSGGQRQRVAMGRAIVREPKVFCMDEPLSNLDAQLRVQTRTQIAELQRRLGVTTVYVTHDQVEAMTMGDRVAVMRLGQLQQFASPTELYDRPANVFVASFIGSPAMNRFDATAERDGIRLGSILLRPSDAQLRAVRGHGKLVAGIRPEHLSIGDGPFAVEVALVEDLGSDSYVYGHLTDDPASHVIVRSGRKHPRPGEVIKVAIDTGHLHLFDAGTGLRIGELTAGNPTRKRHPRGDMMRAVIWEEPGKLAVTEAADPAPRHGELVIQVGACGICGTDVHIADGEFPPTPYPIIPGHEFGGRVVACGEGVPAGWREGERVAVDPSLFCGYCPACRSGRGNLCANWNAIGDTVSGAFAEYVAVPAANAYRIPDSVNDAQAALIEPLSCAVHGLRRIGPVIGEDILLTGAGTMGLLLLQLLNMAGARSVSVVDRKAARLQAAKTLGAASVAEDVAALDRRMFGVAVDATGAPAAIEACFRSLDRGGRLLIFGVTNGDAMVSLSPFRIYNDEITVVGSMAVLNSFGAATDLMAAGAIDTAPLLGPPFGLAEFPDALASVRAGEGIKIQVAPGL